MRIAEIARPVLDRLVPARCQHCDAAAAAGPWAPFLCPPCGRSLTPEPRRRLPHGGQPLCTLAPFDGPVRSLVHALKYRGNLVIGRRLGAALGEWLLAVGPKADLLVPVPLHWRRRWARGHDQARVLAGGAATTSRIAVLAALRRRRPTRPQVGLGEVARRRNVRDAFAVRRCCHRRLRDRRVLVVDDVVTTGSTASVAAAALQAAGARPVGVAAVARVPSPEADDGFRDGR